MTEISILHLFAAAETRCITGNHFYNVCYANLKRVISFPVWNFLLQDRTRGGGGTFAIDLQRLPASSTHCPVGYTNMRLTTLFAPSPGFALTLERLHRL